MTDSTETNTDRQTIEIHPDHLVELRLEGATPWSACQLVGKELNRAGDLTVVANSHAEHISEDDLIKVADELITTAQRLLEDTPIESLSYKELELLRRAQAGMLYMGVDCGEAFFDRTMRIEELLHDVEQRVQLS